MKENIQIYDKDKIVRRSFIKHPRTTHVKSCVVHRFCINFTFQVYISLYFVSETNLFVKSEIGIL